MIRKIEKIETPLQDLHIVICSFFEQMSHTGTYSEISFPDWFKEDYKGTQIHNKLQEIFNLFQELEYKSIQKGLISIFDMNNEVERICKRDICTTYIEKDELKAYYDEYSPQLIDKIASLFDSLYSNYINRESFNNRVNMTIRNHIRAFNKKNGRICVFCGLDHNMVIDGQSRPALDHWLPKSKFPFTAINFNNLIPACESCNEKKDAINFLSDNYSRREVGYYPYSNKDGIKSVMSFKELPTTSEHLEADNLEIIVSPINPADQSLFNSWKKVFNIEIRFKSWIDEVFRDWEEEYDDYIGADADLDHADNIKDFKYNIGKFKTKHSLKFDPAAIIYHSICNYLLEEAEEIYLIGLYKRFNE